MPTYRPAPSCRTQEARNTGQSSASTPAPHPVSHLGLSALAVAAPGLLLRKSGQTRGCLPSMTARLPHTCVPAPRGLREVAGRAVPGDGHRAPSTHPHAGAHSPEVWVQRTRDTWAFLWGHLVTAPSPVTRRALAWQVPFALVDPGPGRSPSRSGD